MSPTTELRYKTFAGEYVTNGFNATQAALAAGYSPKTADRQGHALLRNPKVEALIAELTKPAMDRYAITVENTLKHLAAVAYAKKSDVGRWGTDGGRPYFMPYNSEDLPEDVALSVREVKFKAKFHPARVDKQGNQVEAEYWDIETNVAQHDKVAALKVLASYQGLLPTTGKVRINVDARQQTLAVDPATLKAWVDKQMGWDE